jgi:hypothetical protein
MRRWIALGVVALALAWGPYLYSELARRPAHAPSSAPIAAGSLFDEPREEQPAAPSGAARLESHAAAATEPATSPQIYPAQAVPASEPEPEPAAADAPAAAGNTLADPAGLPAELVPVFHSAFDVQPRDAFWAQTEEPRLSGLFHTIGLPDGMISAVNCRKTVCRATFSSTELDKEIELKMYARLREEYGNSMALEVRDLEGGARAALYVLRPGYKLEAPAPAPSATRP